MFRYWSFIASFLVLMTLKNLLFRITKSSHKQTNKQNTLRQTTKHHILLVVFWHGGLYDGVHDGWYPGATFFWKIKMIILDKIFINLQNEWKTENPILHLSTYSNRNFSDLFDKRKNSYAGCSRESWNCLNG